MPNLVRDAPGGAILAVKLQPHASSNQIGPPVGDELPIKVTAPPAGFAANEALIRLLAITLSCARGRVEIVRGHKSRHKLIRLHGFTPEQISEKLLKSQQP